MSGHLLTKRFVVFAGASYYAEGGWGDFISSHDDEREARKAAIAQVDSPDTWGVWAHVVDLKTGKVLASEKGWHCGEIPDAPPLRDQPEETR